MDVSCYVYVTEPIVDPIKTLYCLAPKDFVTISLANLLTLSVPDECF